MKTSAHQATQPRIAPILSKGPDSLDIALAGIRKEFGDEAVRRLGDAPMQAVEVISTGDVIIDTLLGVGGLARGRVCEIYGPESSGKTTFCLGVIAAAQRKGGRAAFIDVEHAFDRKQATVIGVQTDDLLFAQPGSGEEALTITERLAQTGAVDVIVVDSVAALVPKAELEGEMGDMMTMGSQARLMSQAMRRLTSVISRTKTVLIFTNQLREKIGVMFGSPETTPGGRALKFFSSVRIDIRRKDAIKSTGGTTIGNRIKVKIVKNKVAAPFAEAELDLYFDEGISSSTSLLYLALDRKVIEKKGSWFSFQGQPLAQGQEEARLLLRSNRELAEQIHTAVGLALKPQVPTTEEIEAELREHDLLAETSREPSPAAA